MKGKRHEKLQRKPAREKTIPRKKKTNGERSGYPSTVSLDGIHSTPAGHAPFRGDEYPLNFRFTWNMNSEPPEGTVIGYAEPVTDSDPGQILFWESGGVVGRSKNR